MERFLTLLHVFKMLDTQSVADKPTGVHIGLTSQTLKYLEKIHLSIPVSPL